MDDAALLEAARTITRRVSQSGHRSRATLRK
jgi:hypothetical protein